MKPSRTYAALLVGFICVFALAGRARAFYGGPTGFVVLSDVFGLSGVSSFAFTPDGRLLYCERTTGAVRVVEDGDLLPGAHLTVPGLTTDLSGDAGLLGIAVDPDFETPGESYIYLYYTQDAPRVNRVVRYLETGGEALGAPETVLDDIPAGQYHNAGVLAFGPDKTLFVQTGDTVLSGLPGYGQLAQDLTSLAGKVLRVNRDGSVPADNPFAGSANANTRRVFSYGHRNGFGLAPDFLRPDPPRVYVSENGWDTEDELDLSRGGLDFGWPTVEGTAGATPGDGFEDPVRVWNPIAAPTGIVQYRGAVYPAEYRGGLFVNLYVGRLVTDGVLNGRVWTDFVRLNAAGDAVAGTDAFIVFNTLSASAPVALVEGPDGVLYLATESTIYRVHFPLGEAVYDVTPPGYPAPYSVGDAIQWLMVQSGLVS